jgi:hypothetical protein
MIAIYKRGVTTVDALTETTIRENRPKGLGLPPLEPSTIVPLFVSMPLYYFHIFHETQQTDHDGRELPDQHAAWKEATVTAGQILQGIDGHLKPGREWHMEVADEFQNTLFMLHISARKPT